ncbi:MAG: hypothetical protein U1E69_19080 [Tabrizicola sp.]|uniref:hypothetical protein n=1 Tax=Tabrizicola sp. TaxID=2005166 RepID=UPI002AB86422|nr:hypothetical protein [Tabrizicola sp.]MDZ4088899.1 hypothetical protein [Tabrizicola sp.]
MAAASAAGIAEKGRVRSDLKIAVVFFGITRALRLTLPSITANLVDPARAIAREVRLFGHFFRQTGISNLRSGEVGALDPEEYRLLNLDAVEQEEPGACLDLYPMAEMQARGDIWRDDFASFRNLVHQLHSLKRATLLAEGFQPDIVIFARPDLLYHDSAAEHLDLLARAHRSFVLVPDWSQWFGHNDRFALVKGAESVAAYGRRADRMGEYCARGKRLHSERFLKYALGGQRVRTMHMRASRVRANGLQVLEDFTPGRGPMGKRELVAPGTIRPEAPAMAQSA